MKPPPWIQNNHGAFCFPSAGQTRTPTSTPWGDLTTWSLNGVGQGVCLVDAMISAS